MFEAHVYRSGGRELPYRLFVPDAADGPLPLVVFLHGVGERGDDNEAQLRVGVDGLAAWCANPGHPAVMVVPQCPADDLWAPVNSDWTAVERCDAPPAAQQLAIGLVRELAARLPVDPDRLYLAGLSMGAFGVWDILGRVPDLFAAALPVCGGGLTEAAPAMAQVPVWAFHGTIDPLVPVHQSRRMVAAVRKAGGTARYTEYPHGEHNVWDAALHDPDVLTWLFAQRK